MILICVPDGRSLTLALLSRCSWFNHPITRLPAIAPVAPCPYSSLVMWNVSSPSRGTQSESRGRPWQLMSAPIPMCSPSVGCNHHRVLVLNHASKSMHTISHTRSELVRVSCLFPVTVRALGPVGCVRVRQVRTCSLVRRPEPVRARAAGSGYDASIPI